MVLEILEHRPDTQVLPIFFKDGSVPDRFEDVDRQAFCFSDGWLANLNSEVKVQSVAQKALHLLRKHGDELACKLNNKNLKYFGGDSIPSLLRGRRLKESMQAIAKLQAHAIKAMPKDEAVTLLVQDILELLNTRTQAQRDDHDYEHRDAGTRHGAGGGSSSSNVKGKRPLEGDGSQGAASKMPKPENHEGARSKAQVKRDARTDRDIGAAGSSPDAKRPSLIFRGQNCLA